jgi:hypothetical protein
MRILLVGASSTGKSTILKMMGKKYKDLKLITEVVRRLVKSEGLVINEGGRTATQKRVFDIYLKELEQDNYVSDRCLVDVLGYSFANYALMDLNDPERPIFHEECQRQMAEVIDWFNDHDDVKLIYFPIEFDSVDDGVRSTDEGYRQSTDYFMKRILNSLRVNYLTVHGTPEERMKQISEYIG